MGVLGVLLELSPVTAVVWCKVIRIIVFTQSFSHPDSLIKSTMFNIKLSSWLMQILTLDSV